MKTITVDNQKITPSKILCIGRNYAEHIAELGNEIPDDMVVFNKPNSAISTELCSYHQEPLHYEGELCFVVTHGQFSAVGFGLDLTKRTLQSKLKAKGLPWERAKAFNGSAVFSDFVTVDEDVSQLTMELSINGEVKQASGCSYMIYKPEILLSEISSFMTLQDNDIVMTGTPSGVGKIQHGDEFNCKLFNGDDLLVERFWQVKHYNNDE